jgi:hypothetical protein
MSTPIKIKRALTPQDILNKKYTLIKWEGDWELAFEQPEICGVWFIWGNSGNGKSSFVMQLVKELSKYGAVFYNALEEAARYTMQKHMIRNAMTAASGKVLFEKESLEALEARMNKPKSPQFWVIDSFQYLGLTYRQYIAFKERHPKKLIIFISHAKGSNPKGDHADSVAYDADLKIFVEGFVAFSKGRYLGKTGEYTIWSEGAAKIWGAKQTTE